MSDELMIQPQVVQPQKKDNSLLYATGAGLVGGAGGYYAANKWTGKFTSHDDIIKDAKDQVDLKAKYANADEASIKGVTDAVKEVKEAEAALEAAKKPVLAADAPEQLAYDEAKKAYDDAFNKFVEEETARLEKSGGKAGSADKFLDFNKIKDHKEWPAANDKGQAIKTEAQARAYYDKLKANITKAENGFGTDIRNAERAITDAETSIESYLTGVNSRFAGESNFNRINNKFDKKTFNISFGPLGEVKYPTGEYGKAFEAAKQLHPNKTTATLKYEDYAKFGDVTDKRPASGRFETFKVYNAETGKNDTKYVTYTNEARNKYIGEYNKSLHETRLATADELYEIARQDVINNKKLNNFDAIYAEEGLVREARKGNLYDAGSKKIKVTEMFNEHASRIAAIDGNPIKDKHGNILQGFHADIKAIKQAKSQGLDHTHLMLNGNYGTETNLDKVLEMAEAKQRLLDDYNLSKKELKKEIKNAKQTTTVVKDLKAKAQGLKNGDSAYSKAIQEFREAFPTLFKEGEAGGVVDDIAGKAKAFAEGKTGDLKKTMEEKLGILDKAKAEKGVANEEAIKKAQELLNGKQNTAIERAKSLAEKLGKEGGVKGWVGGLAGLAILGGLGYMIGKPSDS